MERYPIPVSLCKKKTPSIDNKKGGFCETIGKKAKKKGGEYRGNRFISCTHLSPIVFVLRGFGFCVEEMPH